MNILGHALRSRLEIGSVDNVDSDASIAFGLQNVSSQVLAAEACAAAPVGILGAQSTAWLQTAKAPARCYFSHNFLQYATLATSFLSRCRHGALRVQRLSFTVIQRSLRSS